jgi:hypothetical protein
VIEIISSGVRGKSPKFPERTVTLIVEKMITCDAKAGLLEKVVSEKELV